MAGKNCQTFIKRLSTQCFPIMPPIRSCVLFFRLDYHNAVPYRGYKLRRSDSMVEPANGGPVKACKGDIIFAYKIINKTLA